MQRGAWRNGGFTLIEILLAMVILLVGIVGVLGIFPVAIRNVNDSVEDSTASNLAQSLSAAVTEAVRRPVGGEVTLTHDGLPGGRLTFKLPGTLMVPDSYPVPGGGTDPTLEVYQLGTDAAVASQVDHIRTNPAGGDPTEPTRQYSFQFEVLRPKESEIVIDTAGAPTRLPLYQFRFLIYRSYDGKAGGPANLVKEFTILVAASGE